MTYKGQCTFEAVTGTKYCSVHGGIPAARNLEKARINQYRLAKYGSRVTEFGSNSDVKGLRDEIGILRMLIEEKINRCSDTDDLIMQSHQISELVMKVQKTVESCHKLESSMGQLLDKQAVIQFAEGLIKILCTEIADASLLDRIAAQVKTLTENTLTTLGTQSCDG